MPCDLIQRQTVDFVQARNHEAMLAEALRELGFSVVQNGSTLQFSGNGISGNYANGRFNTSSYNRSSMDLDAVKREFGKVAVKTACKKYGWAVKQQGSKFTITKRV